MFVRLTEFPNSSSQPFKKTSEPTPEYNCIAWAFGDSKKCYWPDKYHFWPAGLKRIEIVDSFVELFSSIGYTECENGDLVDGFEKVAIYTDKNGIPTHAARQLTSGYWTSKLGHDMDIRHTLASMDGGYYGNATIFMQRKTNS